jgi:hypothetical protein
MKKKSLFALGLLTIVITTILLYSCRKSHTSEEEMKKPFINLRPVSYTTFSTIEDVNDNIRAMAFAMASIQDTMFLISRNPTLYKNEIEAQIPTDEEEASFQGLNTAINTTTTGHLYKTRTNSVFSDLDDMVQGALNDQQPLYYTTSPRGGLTNFYDYTAFANFRYNNTDYYTLVRIPDWATLNSDASRLSKPLLVIPNEVDTNDNAILPIIGYKINTTTWEVDSVLFQTEEDLDDQTTYYIWVVDYAPVPLTGTGSSFNCSGDNAPQPNDDFCDLNCGENAGSSFNDCNPALIKRVWIDEIEITEDYKQKCGTNIKWQERNLNGRYEIAFQAMTVHGSGKVSQRGGLLEEEWQRLQIKRSKKKNIGCSYNNGAGSATNKGSLSTKRWWRTFALDTDTTQKTKSSQPKCYLSTNYKPWRDTIYFVVYEFDGVDAAKREHKIKVNFRVGKQAELIYHTRKNEGPFGDKTNTNLLVAFNAISPTLPTAQVYMITPGTWPGGGGIAVNTDTWTFNAMPVNSGSNPDARSIKVKVSYGFF